jgi:hypothetical protein
MLILFLPGNDKFTGVANIYLTNMLSSVADQSISVMDALDLVKECYADNFDKVYYGDTEEEYYYKLSFADYYLVYEGTSETEKDYLFHLYEFVIDEPDTGIGHMVTYGWYTVDSDSGELTDQTQ